jgi:hypothetical protein
MAILHNGARKMPLSGGNVAPMKPPKYLSIALLCWMGLPALLIAAPQPPLYIGVLEGPQTDATPPNPPICSTLHVRVAFKRQGQDWQPLPTDFGTPSALAQAQQYYPASVNWTVVYNGKSLGRLSSRDPGVLHWYADSGTQIITTNAADVPIVRTGAADFRYVLSPAQTRPLLLVSVENYKDPEAWRRSTVTLAEKQLLAAEFRKNVPDTERCDAPERTPIHLLPYRDNKIAIIKAYRNHNGELLVGEELHDPQANCGFFNDQHFFNYWFIMDQQHRIRYLDSGMTAVDAVDLEHSGRSAWVFFASRGEDENGYELFYNDFERRAYFHWTYH